MKVKNDHLSTFSNLSNWKEETCNNQGFNGIQIFGRCITGSNPIEALIFSRFFFAIA